MITEVGNGANTKFWTDKWLNGNSMELLAPQLFAQVSKRRARSHMVQEGLQDNQRVDSVEVLVQDVMLLLEKEDNHRWRLEYSGQFSSKSAYEAFFNRATLFKPKKLI
jgi:hypothetical protein